MSIWTREVKSVAAFSVHDILSGMYLGLLHKIENVYKHSKVTVYQKLTSYQGFTICLLPCQFHVCKSNIGIIVCSVLAKFHSPNNQRACSPCKESWPICYIAKKWSWTDREGLPFATLTPPKKGVIMRGW